MWRITAWPAWDEEGVGEDKSLAYMGEGGGGCGG